MKLQLMEITYLLMMPPVILILLLNVLGELTFTSFIVLTGLVLSGGGIAILIFLYSIRYSKVAFYNWISGFVELHLGRGVSLQKNVRQAVRLGQRLGKNVMFYTNHYPEERLRTKWEGKIIIKRANTIQSFFFNLTYYLITTGKKRGKRYPVLQCEILCDSIKTMRN
ncbi:hypothetical protein [Metabacillus sp. SLBN-84]